MGRVDYIDDPQAPAANSRVPSVVACVVHQQQVLLIEKRDNGLWALPGGGHEIGEAIADTVVREVLEETGYQVTVVALTGVYTNPGHVMAYDDGEVRQQFSIAFRAELASDDQQPHDDESLQVGWFSEAELDDLPMHPSMRLRIAHALRPAATGPHIG